MPIGLIMSVSALIALVPAALLPLRGGHRRDATFWILLAVAIAGPLGVVYVLFAPGWRTGLSSALWLTRTRVPPSTAAGRLMSSGATSSAALSTIAFMRTLRIAGDLSDNRAGEQRRRLAWLSTYSPPLPDPLRPSGQRGNEA